MKKLVSVLLFALMFVNCLQAQTTEKLTNATIVKMVKAKLSDDLIIDEINSSKVNFDVSADAVKSLSDQNVSDQVIQAMKALTAIQPTEPAKESVIKTIAVPVAPPAQSSTEVVIEPTIETAVQNTVQPVPEIHPQTPSVPLKTDIKQPADPQINAGSSATDGVIVEAIKTEGSVAVSIQKAAFTINANSYVSPTKDLIAFYNSQFASLAATIKDWDKKLKASIEKEIQSTESIDRIEKELTDKKNADAKPFGKDIADLKKTLFESWEKHNVLKSGMVAEGKSLSEDLKKTSKETQNAIATKYKEVIKLIKNSKPDPSVGERMNVIQIPGQKFSLKLVPHFAPVTMMLVYYQNEIMVLQEMISTWNAKVMNSFQKDSELKQQLEPLQNELNQYLATPKQNQKLKKKEIATLKKQCESIEKDRKLLAKQMASDSDKLSEDLNKLSTEIQGKVEERFTDIIQSIEHSYKDKFNE